MKKFLKYLLFCFVLLFCKMAVANQSQADIARQWALNKGEEILQILASKDLEYKYAELDKILYEDIDLDHAARFVVGRYWRQMSDEQKAIYIPLFKRYTAAVYKSFPLDVPQNSIGYEILKIQQNQEFFDVFCSINLNNKEQNEKEKAKINVIFSLTKKADKIMVRDLKIGESSLLVAYRERFYKMIHQDSDDEIDWFLEDLETLTQDKEEENLRLLEKNKD